MRKECQFIDEKIVSESKWEASIAQIEQNDSVVIATFVNPFSYPILMKRPELIEQFNHIFSDGALHTKLHNIFCKNKIDRVSFDLSSIAQDTLIRAQKNQLKVAFIGGKPEHANDLPGKLLELFPGLNIVLCHDGYFNGEQEKEECIKGLHTLKPDIVIIGMGTPLQEEFLLKAVENVSSAREFYTCGGFLEQTATKGDYYHPIVKKLGIRWLQRAIMHSHVRKRLFLDYPRFIFSYIKSHI